MRHIAMQEWLNGTPETWLEKVSDEEYMSAAKPDSMNRMTTPRLDIKRYPGPDHQVQTELLSLMVFRHQHFNL